MNTDASMMTASDSFNGSNPLSGTDSEVGTMMTCETCDLVGGPFPAAEAAHLRAIHDRLHHGMLFAA